jgi:hypothetical protein
MRTKMLCLSCALGLLMGFGAGSFARADNAEDLINQYLQQLGAEDYHITPVTDPYVASTFPNTVFYGVYFQQYPLTVPPPESLAEANVFFMDKASEQIGYLTGPDDLLAFFEVYWNSVVGPTAGNPLEDAARTWLRLSQEFSQDGFYQFSPPMVEVNGNTAFGMVMVEAGGRGNLWVAMTLSPSGALTVQETRHIHPGIRPL